MYSGDLLLDLVLVQAWSNCTKTIGLLFNHFLEGKLELLSDISLIDALLLPRKHPFLQVSFQPDLTLLTWPDSPGTESGE